MVARTFAEQTELDYAFVDSILKEAAMINLREVQAELSCARQARAAIEASETEIEGLVVDMQSPIWPRISLVDSLLDETYDPHLFRRPN
jgi:hypothetical protein